MIATAPTLETTEARGQFMTWAIGRKIAVEDPQQPGMYILPEGVRLYPRWLPENEAEADIEKYRAYLEGVKLDLARELADEAKRSESFTDAEVMECLDLWLEYGEQSFVPDREVHNKGHRGAFSGNSYAARVLRWHRDQLIKKRENKS